MKTVEEVNKRVVDIMCEEEDDLVFEFWERSRECRSDEDEVNLSLEILSKYKKKQMGELTDLIFSILGKFGRFFNARGKRICFIIWIICLCYWTIRNYGLGLRVQMFSTFISMCLNIYGFKKWKQKEKD